MKEYLPEKSTDLSQRGVALVMALIVTLVAFLLIASVIYMTTQSVSMSGAGKRYATAQQAADGAAELLKELTLYAMNKETINDVNIGGPGLDDLHKVSKNLNGATITRSIDITLPGTGLLSSFKATGTVEYTGDGVYEGSTVRFPPEYGVSSGTFANFRISTFVEGPENTRGETVVYYRHSSGQ